MQKNKKERIFRGTLIGIFELFTLISLILIIVTGDFDNLAICIATFAYILIPSAIEKMFSCKVNPILYAACILYAVCPLLGDGYKLYYITCWWDKLLHTFAGVAFAIFGVFLFDYINRNHANIVAVGIFALCFSVTVSVIWEFVEFTSDTLLKTDMQRDTFVYSINSYILGDAIGEVGRIESIENVTVNGKVLTGGYLDIGLIDTIKDMLFESLGALAFSVIYMVDKGRHPLIKTSWHKDSFGGKKKCTREVLT